MKLRDYEGRFMPSKYKCPKCGGDALEDNYPPNYTHLYTDDQTRYTGGRNIKHVCQACAISFLVVTWYETVDGKVTRDEYHYVDKKPLVEIDGVWLTPKDMLREEYKTKYGYYPIDSL